MQRYFLESKYAAVAKGYLPGAERAQELMNHILEDEEVTDWRARFEAMALFLSQAEERIDQVSGKLRELSAVAARVVRDTPAEVTFLPLGERIDEMATELGLASNEPRRLMKDLKKTTSTQTEPDVYHSETMTAVSALDGSTRFIEAERLVSKSTAPVEPKCAHLIDKVASREWHLFRRMHFQRLYWRFRLRKAAHRSVPTPTGHARLVINAFIGFRGVLQRQIEALEAIKKEAAGYEEYGASWFRYVSKLNKRQYNLLVIIMSTFEPAFDFAYHLVRHLSLAPVKPLEQSSLYGAGGAAAFKAKEESVKKLMQRKPWLFLQTVSGDSLPPISGSRGGEGFGSLSGTVTVNATGDTVDLGEPLQIKPSPPRVQRIKELTAKQRKARERTEYRQEGAAQFVASVGAPFGLDSLQQGPHTARHGGAGSKKVPFFCADCLHAKAQRQPVGPCRTTGCTVAKSFTSVERRPQFSLGPQQQQQQ